MRQQLSGRAGPALATRDSAGRFPQIRGSDHDRPWSTYVLKHLTETDRRLFRQFGAGPSAGVPYPCIHHAFEHWASVQPNAVAAEHLGATIRYGELDGHANRLAAHLAACGVRPGDNVAVFTRRSIPMLVAILAALKAGAAYVPQDLGIVPAAQLRHVVQTASTRVILTESGTLGDVPALEGHVAVPVDTFMATRPRVATGGGPFTPAREIRPDDGCYVLFTSGTTGQPNGVTVTHRNVCNIVLTAPGNLGIRPGWRVAQVLNIGFDMAAWEMLGCLGHGGTLLLRDRNIGETVSRADVVIATPTVLGSVDMAQCQRVKVVAVAGEPCPRSLADQWARDRVFYNCCGPTETTIVNTMHRHDPAAACLTIGRPTPNNTVYVLDSDGRPCRIGDIGEMWAGGDCVSVGYLSNPQLNAERYAPDPFLGGGRMMFRTRDLGRWTPDGELEHLGRTDDQVKIRGFRVELDSVSAVLESLPECARAVTMKLDDRTLVSFVSPAHVDPQQATAAVAAALPYYCVPSVVYPVAALPMTARGKVDKAALRRLAFSNGSRTDVDLAAGSPGESVKGSAA
jgi:amino acid adenylation domain-containing protein